MHQDGRALLLEYLATGVSASDLARRAGVDVSTVLKFKAGTRRPSLTTAMAMETASDGAIPARSWVVDEAPDDDVEEEHPPTLKPGTDRHEVSS